jgi:membrane protease YdiL (CAAX protease family)
MEQAPPPPEHELAPAPDPSPQPNWPPWFAFVGFIAALVCTTIATILILAIAGIDPDDESPAIVVVATLIQGIFFVGVALVLARSIAPPRPWHFGLRRARLWPTIGWAALGMFSFYVLTATYAALVKPDAEQDVTDKLGAGDGTLGLVAAGLMVIVVAPFVEEFFFRGFFYRALRTRYPIVLAVFVNGLVFGLIHFGGGSEDTSAVDMLLLLPPLGFLGAIFCLVYEKTKSLWAVIGMHAFNNTIAFSAQADEGWKVAVVAGPAMLVACVLLPRLLPDGPSPLPPAPSRVGPEAQLSLPIQ